MSIPVGTRIGTYEIKALLGKGGMGEVYRAHDTRLKRDVAIKVLLGNFLRDGFDRFHREAEALAALNHPNIAQIYELEGQEDRPCIVMELVEGATLQDRLAQGPLSVDECLRVAKQIAGALEAAHDRGIIHRDLKPANIMLTNNGNVKILDFGLAKSLVTNETATPLSNSPTFVSGSIPGAILGTASYMSPEQARGLEVDKRTDIWAFGCILHEMLTGKQAFSGDTVTDIMARILERDPDFQSLAGHAPKELVAICRRCLQKDPRRRSRNIGDVGLELEEVLSTDTSVQKNNAGRNWQPGLVWIALAMTVAVVATLAILNSRQSRTAAETVRFAVFAPSKSAFASTAIAPFQQSISPNGLMLAFIATTEGRRLLWIRALDSLEARVVPGTDGAFGPFWSPDNRFVGFSANRNLQKVDINGGAPQTICEAGVVNSGSWHKNGLILFVDAFNGLFQVPASGGVAKLVAHPTGADNFGAASFLPDGRRYIYSYYDGTTTVIHVGSLDGETPTRLFEADYAEYFAAAGSVVYSKSGKLMSQKFDTRQLRLIGETVQLSEGLVGSLSGSPNFSLSDNGVLSFGSGGSGTQVVWMDRQGNQVSTIAPPAPNVNVQLSPDEEHVALQRNFGDRLTEDIAIIDLMKGQNRQRQFTFDPARDLLPIWSPDGSRVLFGSMRAGRQLHLYEKPMDGAGDDKLVFASKEDRPTYPMDWSRDDYILIQVGNATAGTTYTRLWTLPLFGDRTPSRLSREEQTAEGNAQFSPDGHWVAYTSYETPKGEIYIQPFPATGAKYKISANGGDQPRWRGDGKELFYVAPNRRLMSVEITAGKTIQAGTPRALFDTRIPDSFIAGWAGFQYDVSRDGQRFVVNTEAPDAVSSFITVVLNWTNALPR